MDVFLLWHVRHARNLDGSQTEHRDEDGEPAIDEQFDDLKIIGIYDSADAAEEAMVRARQLPGFKDEPDCFMVDGYTLGEDAWTDGFVSEPHDPE